MQLDHATIVTADVDAVRDFLRDIVGLADGPRPPFGVDGHWLYAEGRPVLHLVAAAGHGAALRASPRIDHVAFRIADAAEWQALVARLEAAGVPYQRADVPLSGERQLFIALAPGVVLEFVTALA